MSSTCGNGRIEGDEACDTGHLCETSPTYKAACEALGLRFVDNSRCNEDTCKYNDSLCGNGKIDKDKGEDCDSRTDPLCNPNTCKWYCGDGTLDVNKGEECDMGALNNDEGNTNCTTKCRIPSCGDGIVSTFAGEICDDGQNNSTYGKGKCMAGCMRWAPYCGDGIVQSDHGEACDLGTANNNGVYGGCNSDCSLAPHCGDGHVDTENGETCEGDSSECVNCRKQVN